MSIKIKDAVPLDNTDGFITWTEIFEAQARSRQITDDKMLTDAFLSNAGLKELMEVKQLVAPKKTTDLGWNEIKTAIKNFLEPTTRLLIAERTTFMRMRQQNTSESIAEFAARLREQAVKCEFGKFKEGTANPAEELTRMRLIAGICGDETRNKILEKELTAEMTTEQIVEFTMQLSLVKSFVSSSGRTENSAGELPDANINAVAKNEDRHCEAMCNSVNVNRVLTSNAPGHQRVRTCYSCGSSWHARLQDCRDLNTNCRKCGVKGNFAKVCRNKEKMTNFFDASVQDEDIFFCGPPSKTDHCFINIDGHKMEMEKDTGASCS